MQDGSCARQRRSVASLSPTSPLGAGDDYETPSALSVTIDPRGIVFLTSTFKDAQVYGFDIREPKLPRHVFEAVPACGDETYSQACAVWNNQLIIAGSFDEWLDIEVPQNVGLYYVAQTQPGSVLPIRPPGQTNYAPQ
jgi:hypothetical protein